MGIKCLAIERNNSFQNKNVLSKNNFEKKYLVGKGGFSKVITKLNKFHYIFFIIEILVYRYGKLNINKIKKYMQ